MIIKELNLKRPIYKKTASGGHFGRNDEDFTWEKIKDLSNQISEQEEVIKAYQAKFAEFEDNLNKLMRLDKDIHTKLVNPEHSATL